VDYRYDMQGCIKETYFTGYFPIIIIIITLQKKWPWQVMVHQHSAVVPRGVLTLGMGGIQCNRFFDGRWFDPPPVLMTLLSQIIYFICQCDDRNRIQLLPTRNIWILHILFVANIFYTLLWPIWKKPNNYELFYCFRCFKHILGHCMACEHYYL
jgi:hypothetical protein